MNKNFFLGVNTGYYEFGIPTEECLRFYRERSGNDIYCSIVGNIVIKNGFATNNSAGIMSDHKSWTILASEIERNGTLPGIQLSSTWENYEGQKTFTNLYWEQFVKATKDNLHNININTLFENIKLSFDLAIFHNFKHIQIHAAHGYLLSLLLDPYFYYDTDLIVKELTDLAIYYKDRVEISIRLSGYCGLEETAEEKRLRKIKKLFNNTFDYIDLSEGYYNYKKMLIYPHSQEMRKNRLERCISIAKLFPTQKFIFSSCNTSDVADLDNVHVGYCRNIIANPKFFVNKLQICNLCGDCHYFSNDMTKLSCSKW